MSSAHSTGASADALGWKTHHIISVDRRWELGTTYARSRSRPVQLCYSPRAHWRRCVNSGSKSNSILSWFCWRVDTWASCTLPAHHPLRVARSIYCCTEFIKSLIVGFWGVDTMLGWLWATAS